MIMRNASESVWNSERCGAATVEGDATRSVGLVSSMCSVAWSLISIRGASPPTTTKSAASTKIMVLVGTVAESINGMLFNVPCAISSLNGKMPVLGACASETRRISVGFIIQTGARTLP